jgi:hypothetical protein
LTRFRQHGIGLVTGAKQAAVVSIRVLIVVLNAIQRLAGNLCTAWIIQVNSTGCQRWELFANEGEVQHGVSLFQLNVRDDHALIINPPC